MQINSTALVLISTPGGDQCALNTFINKTERHDSSIPCFITVYIETVCANCRNTPRQFHCRHIYQPPEWKDNSKIDSILVLYSDEQNAIREMFGLESATPGAFIPGHLDIFKSNIHYWENQAAFEYIYIGIDMGGMGDSETSIISIARLRAPNHDENPLRTGRTEKSIVLLGANSFITRDIHHIRQELNTHLIKLKSMPYYNSSRTKILILPEISNISTLYIKEIVRGLHDVLICFTKGRNKNDDKCGLYTDEQVKHSAVVDIETMIGKELAFVSNMFFTTSYSSMSREVAAKFILNKFFEQMKNFKKYIEITSKGRYSCLYTGKSTGKKQSSDSFKKDDMVMSFIIAIYWMDVIAMNRTDIVIEKAINIKVPKINEF